jgi:putative ABC transport system substrate-binding protein
MARMAIGLPQNLWRAEMRRREFIAGLVSAAAWPLVARAQQGDRVRRIGALMSDDENDPEQKHRLSAFAQALADLGWTDGRNVRTRACPRS